MMRAKVAEAVRLVQEQIRWKPGSAASHLRKRIMRGHLARDTTRAEYEQIIHSVVSDRTATVYLYTHSDEDYVAIVAAVENQAWLAMFGLDGVLESAFVVERPELYLSKAAFDRRGTLDEVLS